MKQRQKTSYDKAILLQIIEKIANLDDLSEEAVAKVISKHPAKDSSTFSKSQVLEAYNNVKNTLNYPVFKHKKVLNALKMKKVRTISGVTPVAILTKPFSCPGNCIYCPNDVKMPKSYLSAEPGAQRALQNHFDPYLQVFNRLVAYKNIGHSTDKVELIVLGGTWSFYPKNYQLWFIKRAFDAMNDFSAKKTKYLGVSEQEVEKAVTWRDLYISQKKNETAKSRCVGLVLETRPDYIDEEEVRNLRKLGATKIQLGVQSLDDEILKLNNRGHGVRETKQAFKLLRDAGFKIHAHWMPNLYGSNPNKDIQDYKKLFEDASLRPDELKIYPCSLIKDTVLYDLYKKKKWKPYTEKQLLGVLTQCMAFTPRYCRLSRVVRDISSDDIVVGNKKSNFRQIAEKNLIDKEIKLNEIRSREIKDEKAMISNLEFKLTAYDTAGSKEYFLEFVTSEDRLAGFLRLSLPLGRSFLKEIQGSAIIREVHVYGASVEIGKSEKNKAQHIGLGTKLMNEAEKIAKEKGFKKISVISAIGTREYYKKRGYTQNKLYQVKNLI